MKYVIVTLILSIALLTAISCSSTKNMTSVSTGDNSAVESTAGTEARDGMSFEKAVIVKSIDAEYKWIEKNYPGSRVKSQALVQKNGKPHDVLTFVTQEGETKVAHFDISKFFGKGF